MGFEELAARTGAADLFVLSRIDEHRLFNLDGVGRGKGWAGNLSLSTTDEPLLDRASDGGSIVRRRSGVPFRAFGPYWTTNVAIVPAGKALVVFGGPGLTTADPDLWSAAASAAQAVAGVPAGKDTADRAELEAAIAAVRSLDADTIENMAEAIATTAATALSCEFGAVLLNGTPPRLRAADLGWRPLATDEEIIAALMPLYQAARGGMIVEQDLALSSFPYRPLSRQDGLVARCAVPLGPDGELGLLVIAHAGTAARGFTDLCQRVARGVGRSASEMLGQRLARD